ncbi:MAG TPA: DinB family protein [Longimicrobiales bacterium]
MTAHIEQLIDHLSAGRAELRAAFDAVPAAARESVPPGGGWSVAQVIQHLVHTDRMFTQLLHKSIAEIGPGAEGEIDVTAILQSRRMKAVLNRDTRVQALERMRPIEDWPADKAWQLLEQARAELLQQLAVANGVPLSQARFVHYILGEMNLYQGIVFIGSHEMRHAAQIREIQEKLAWPSTT